MILASLTIALAAAAPLGATQNACDNATTTIEVNECAKQDYNRADAKLNATWNDTMAALKTYSATPAHADALKTKLLAAQRLWIQFRDKDCQAVHDLYAEGTIRTVMYWGCMSEHTKFRTKQLRDIADGW